ncbi:hypothetical protein MATL_G00220890, partial [Megalops atlanticus]
SKPRITNTTAAGSRGRFCSVLCSVENGREVTLFWQREGQTLSHTSSPDLNTPLSLPLEIEEYSSTYSCMAANPASEERSFFNISELCREECTDQSDQRPTSQTSLSVCWDWSWVCGFDHSANWDSRLPEEQKKPAGDEGDELTYANINHGAKKTQPEKAQKSQAGNPEELVYSNINHNRPKKQRAEAPRAAQGEENCVYAQVRR